MHFIVLVCLLENYFYELFRIIHKLQCQFVEKIDLKTDEAWFCYYCQVSKFLFVNLLPSMPQNFTYNEA